MSLNQSLISDFSEYYRWSQRTKIKYKLHYVDVRGDVLRPPHGTTPAAVKSNKNQKWDPLRWKLTKLNNGVRGQKNTPPEYSIFWENISVFSLCVIINPSFSRRHEIGMVLAFLTSSNSRLKLHIFGNYLQTNWSIEMIFTPKCLFRQVLLISASLILQIRPRNV